jgi:hypothetical protein
VRRNRWLGSGALTQRPPGRILADQRLGLLAGVAGEAGGDGAGLHFHNLYGERRQLHAQCIAQGMHGGLGRAVGAGEWRNQYAGDAADIDHQATAAAQQREQRAGHPDDGEDIGFELLAHGLHAAVEQRAHGAIAGVVDQHIEAADLFTQASCQLLQRLAVVDVELHGMQPGLFERREVTVLARRGPDRVAARLEGVGQGAADAAGAACDQNAGLRHGGVPWAANGVAA